MHFFFKKNLTNGIPDLESQQNKVITFSTCFYIIRSKFPIHTYLEWIKNLLSIVNNFNLVIYTNEETIKYIFPLIDQTNKKIKVIIKPLTDFYTYGYKDKWIENHKMSTMDLHKKIDWELNMLWNEKVFFVYETITQNYFESLYYGWCDIGYFRNRRNDLHTNDLTQWPNPIKLLKTFRNTVIHYGCVQTNLLVYNELTNKIISHYNNKLTDPPTSNYNTICFAGGFFILTASQINHYATLYKSKLDYYFDRNYFIKDDQTIVQDIILTNPQLFCIHWEKDKYFDNWFMFQRLLI